MRRIGPIDHFPIRWIEFQEKRIIGKQKLCGAGRATGVIAGKVAQSGYLPFLEPNAPFFSIAPRPTYGENAAAPNYYDNKAFAVIATKKPGPALVPNGVATRNEPLALNTALNTTLNTVFRRFLCQNFHRHNWLRCSNTLAWPRRPRWLVWENACAGWLAIFRNSSRFGSMPWPKQGC
jgi:hypothetical protein